MRKLRIALDLREEQLLELIELGGIRMSKHELSALFRKEGHKHYRACGDQVVRYFLGGLTKKRRPDDVVELYDVTALDDVASPDATSPDNATSPGDTTAPDDVTS